jgi:MFS family permease
MALVRYVAIVTFGVVQWTVFWRHRTWPLVASQIFGIVSLLLVAMANTSGWFALAFLLMGIPVGFNYYASVYYSIEAFSSEKGKGSGFHESVLGAGLFLGSILSGMVGAWATSSGPESGLRAPYYFCAMMLGVGLLIQGFLFFSGKANRRSSSSPV